MIKIIELSKENEAQFLEQIAELEQIVFNAMNKEGREGQFFTTGKEGISEYIRSEDNTVLVATDNDLKVAATAYITQGQTPFTYNDITKYFKYGEAYNNYVKSQYSSLEQYQTDMVRMYIIKIKAFQSAKTRILAEHPEKPSIGTYLTEEKSQNGFDEKSKLREKINQYMSEYIMQNFGPIILQKYEQFYWTTAEDIQRETGKQCNMEAKDVPEYESFIQSQIEYEEIIHQQSLTIHENPEFDQSLYYSANTSNSIELDTYITDPNSIQSATAKILVFEGIKKHINRHFKNPNNSEIFLCSTLHRDNLPSKYVSEFFGLIDSLYVNRRQGRNREVHICRISREQAMEYLTDMSDKLAVLYGYNPTGKHISTSTKLRFKKEQLAYEERQYAKLTHPTTCATLTGPNIVFLQTKSQKTQKLKEEVNALCELLKKETQGGH